MQNLKNLFKSKTAMYLLGAAVVALVAWYIYTTSKRAKERAGWVAWIKSQPDTDPWKAQLIAKATADGITLDEAIARESYYVTPSNPFKAKK